jgi:hypothetical protein
MTSFLQKLLPSTKCPHLNIFSGPTFLNGYLEFFDYPQYPYHDPNVQGTACCRYCSCIQKPAYFSELQQYLAVLGWSRDLEPVVNKAIKGLKPLLEGKLARKKDQPSLLYSAIGCMFKKNNSYLIKYLSNHCNRHPCYIIHSNSYNGVSQQIELLLAMTAVCCHCACIAVGS